MREVKKAPRGKGTRRKRKGNIMNMRASAHRSNKQKFKTNTDLLPNTFDIYRPERIAIVRISVESK